MCYAILTAPNSEEEEESDEGAIGMCDVCVWCDGGVFGVMMMCV